MRTLGLITAIALFSVACGEPSTDKSSLGDDAAELSSLAGGKADNLYGTTWLMGSLDLPGKSAKVKTSYFPRFRAFKFAAPAGSAVDVVVRTTDGGDALAYVVDNDFRIVAWNDDAPKQITANKRDAHLRAVLPGNSNPDILTYYVVFRDVFRRSKTFVVEVGPLCSYDEAFFAPGSNFPALDGCNTCYCSDNGTVGCTKIACPVPGCTDENGNHYAEGESFPSADGCNTCTCGDGGNIACTEKACACDYTDPNRTWKATNPQTCQVIRFACPAGQVYFGDPSCGCGCETGCDYEGATYAPGQEFPATDGCNTCTCGEGGVVGCTKIGCL